MAIHSAAPCGTLKSCVGWVRSYCYRWRWRRKPIPPTPCSISGQVTNAATGEPVRRALVYLRRIDASPGVMNIQVTQSGTTDAAGRFAIAGIAPGKYRLSAEHNGFLTTQYGSRGPNKAGHPDHPGTGAEIE